MIFNEDQALLIVEENRKLTPRIKFAREQNKELMALVEGEGFPEELIKKIEHLESKEKAEVRKKYSRSVVDFYERLLQPTDNVFSATGGSIKFELEGSELTEFTSRLSQASDNKSITKFVENKWMPLYHTDPNGLIFIEYTTEPERSAYPTYKSIHSVRNYETDGQQLEWLLFEPEILESGVKLWRLVDDEKDWIIREDGGAYSVVEDKTFEHPFGQVPSIVISDLEHIIKPVRIPPIQKIVELSKEYARDQSIKTLFKKLHGFPIFWRYVSQCRQCTGTGKTGEGKCKECDGKGFYQKKDVTDAVTIPTPKKDDVKLAPDLAGYISPDLATWSTMNDELKILERLAELTHWGTQTEEGSNDTATGKFIDQQPRINKLTKYSEAAEYVTWKIVEYLANFWLPAKPKDEPVSHVSLGKRFIIESPDALLKKYEESKTSGAPFVVLDRMLNEFITAKYKGDPSWLRKELLKAELEPYLHMSIIDVNSIFGSKEARKKAFFVDWWESLDSLDLDKEKKKLEEEFTAEFDKLNLQIDDTSSSE